MHNDLCLSVYAMYYFFLSSGVFTILAATTTPSVSVCRDVLPACASINRTLGVCKNQTLARQTCQKFCNLCGIGKTT